MIIDNVDDVRADWRINSDRVMGGVSDVYFNELEDESGSFYRLSGDVRTANNGGFIQSLMVLNKDFKKYKFFFNQLGVIIDQNLRKNFIEKEIQNVNFDQYIYGIPENVNFENIVDIL